MKLNVQKFLEVSSIHGLFYISKRFTVAERAFWIIAFILSVACSVVLIIKLALKMHFVPVVVFVADEPVPVNETPFPAVTVCPQLMPYLKRYLSKHYRYYYFERHTAEKFYVENEELWEEIEGERKLAKLNYTQFFKKYGEDLSFYFRYLDTFEELANGTLKAEELSSKLLKRLQVIDLVTKRGVFSKLNFSVPADDFLDYINQFVKEFEQTSSSFWSSFSNIELNFVSEILTEFGLCYTTNIAFSHDLLNLSSTSNNFHYQLHQPTFLTNIRDSPPTEQPISISGNSELHFNSHTYYFDEHEVVHNDFDGLLVMLHSPYELPSQNSKKFVIHYNREATIWIDTKMNSIDDSLHDYTPDGRNCYLEDERKLKFFKVYTRNNCEMECLNEFMLDRCGCVEFFMIRNSSTRICSASERNCTEGAQSDFLEVKHDDCGCLQPCEYLEYSFGIDESGFLKHREKPILEDKPEEATVNYWTNFVHHRLRFGLSTVKMASVIVKYRQSYFEMFVRKKQFNMLDFLSFFGGLLGLFAGFSALSFVELIYWFTIRLVTEKKTKVHPENDQMSPNSVFTSYLENSSIHGLKFLLSRSKLDLFVWIFFIISSLTVCIEMILKVQEKVPNSRVIVYDDNFRPLKDVSFPAVTFVPEYYFETNFTHIDLNTEKPKLPHVAYKNHSEQLIYLKKLTSEYYCLASYDLLLMNMNISFVPYHFTVLKERSAVDWFRKQFSSLNGLFQPEFAEVRTARGMGFAFNMIDAEEMFDLGQISEQYKYVRNVTMTGKNLQNIPKLNFPLKFSTFDRPSLKFKLVRPETDDYICILPSFLVHNSDYSPTFADREDFIHFQYGMSVNVEVTPKITRVDESLRNLKPDERDCYFGGEKSLKYFRKYTQRNCEIECYTNATFKACNCVDLYQPFSKDSEVCLAISKYYVLEEFCAFSTKKNFDMSDNFSAAKNCSCLPLCNTVTYNVKYTAEFNTKEATGRRTGNETELNMWMNMDEIVLFRRYQQFSSSDVVSYVGGLLGLFAGISMLSFVEFFYFFTLRLGSDLWRRMGRKTEMENGQTFGWVENF